jgi:hypothetical protein
MSHNFSSHGKRWAEWGTGQKVAVIVCGAIAGAGLVALFGFVFMWLWNGLMPRIFKLPAIGYWEGWGLVILASILFKRAPFGGGHQERRRKRMMRERMRDAEERREDEDVPEGGGSGSQA